MLEGLVWFFTTLSLIVSQVVRARNCTEGGVWRYLSQGTTVVQHKWKQDRTSILLLCHVPQEASTFCFLYFVFPTSHNQPRNVDSTSW